MAWIVPLLYAPIFWNIFVPYTVTLCCGGQTFCISKWLWIYSSIIQRLKLLAAMVMQHNAGEQITGSCEDPRQVLWCSHPSRPAVVQWVTLWVTHQKGRGSLTRADTRVFFSCSTAKHLTLSLPGLPYLTLASYQSGICKENMCRYFSCFIQTLKRQNSSYQKLLIRTGILFSLANQELFTRSAIIKIQSFRRHKLALDCCSCKNCSPAVQYIPLLDMCHSNEIIKIIKGFFMAYQCIT